MSEAQSGMPGRAGAERCAMVSLVIFDLDGTLADSFPWFLGVVNDIAREYGFRPDR